MIYRNLMVTMVFTLAVLGYTLRHVWLWKDIRMESRLWRRVGLIGFTEILLASIRQVHGRQLLMDPLCFAFSPGCIEDIMIRRRRSAVSRRH
jgi:hypothetical protein